MMIPNPRTIMPSKRTLYGSVEDGEYFIPFVYTTTTGEIYGAGRFLKSEDLGGGQLHVGFNLACNPYGANNDR